ncbi:hypothetical protein LY76DRAFT_596591 [Colletotrichum caudatum]|nr:hypothetical protein LY76DRAFT_596591 [Colletotrichum caudatum]
MALAGRICSRSLSLSLTHSHSLSRLRCRRRLTLSVSLPTPPFAITPAITTATAAITTIPTTTAGG